MVIHIYIDMYIVPTARDYRLQPSCKEVLSYLGVIIPVMGPQVACMFWSAIGVRT